jgi:cardiolipin synthase A/B
VSFETFTSIAFFVLLGFLLYRTLLVRPSPFQGATPIDLIGHHARTVIAALSDAILCEGNHLDVLTNGEAFYRAELETMRRATRSIHIEVYIFWGGRVADQFTEVLIEKARTGVEVRLLVDGFGSAGLGLRRARLRQLRAAGCEVSFYHPFTPRLFDQINIRTHRELIVVDGRVAFVGGAGIADHWMYSTRGEAWRDMMIRVDGPAVTALQGVFAEDWLEGSGRALTHPDLFPPARVAGETEALVINSSTRGRSSQTQVLHRLLLVSATRTITIVTPYFLPDEGVRSEIVAAARRGVDVRILTVGVHTDLPLLRAGGQRVYGELLEAGVRIFEYEPGMFHVKMLIVDALWAVIGTTNFDNRSFMINDEVNLAVPDAAFCQRLLADVDADLARSQAIVLGEWKRRSWAGRLWEQASRLLERQQ